MGIRLLLASALVLGSQITEAQGFGAPRVRWAKGIYGSGDVAWIAGGNEGVIEVRRGGSARRIGNGAATVIGGSGERVVVAGYRGELARIENGQWIPGPTISASGGDRVVGIAVADDATYVASRHGGLHLWTSNGIRTLPYTAGAEAMAVAVVGDRTFVSGRAGVLFEIRNGALVEPSFAGAVRGAVRTRADLSALWGSPNGRLWIATSARAVVEVDLARDTVVAHAVPLFGRIRVITGDATSVFLGGQSEFGVLQGGSFRPFRGRVSFPEGVFFDQREGVVLVASRDGITGFDLRTLGPAQTTEVAVTVPRATPTMASTTSMSATSSTTSMSGTSMSGMGTSTMVGSVQTDSGLRVENLSAQGCGLIASMAIAARVQEAAGQCLQREGQSFEARMSLRRGVPRNVRVTGDRVGCARRRLARMRIPAAQPSCEVSFRLAR